jgi:hypothetical protein
MDIAEATQQNVIRVVNGKTHEFKRLTMRDIGDLALVKQQIDANKLHVPIQILTDAGIKPDQLPSVIQLLSKPPTFNDMNAWCMTVEGIIQVILFAGGDEEFIDSVQNLELPFLALDIMGIPYNKRSEEEEESEESSGSIPFSQTSQETGT